MEIATPSVISYFTVEREGAFTEPRGVLIQTTLCGQTELPLRHSETSDKDSISDHHVPEPSQTGVFPRRENSWESSVCDSAAMREFFDISAAANTNIDSKSRYTPAIYLGEKEPRTSEVIISRGDETTSMVESESDVPETLTSLIELAERVEDQGKYEWSRMLLQRVIKRHRQNFGNRHLSTLDALQALGRILRRQGRYLEANNLLSGTLETFRTTKGESHTDTLDCMELLALVMIDQGRHDKAEMLARTAQGARLGTDYFGILRSKETLGTVLSSRGEHVEAEQLHREVLEERMKALGE